MGLKKIRKQRDMLSHYGKDIISKGHLWYFRTAIWTHKCGPYKSFKACYKAFVKYTK